MKLKVLTLLAVFAAFATAAPIVAADDTTDCGALGCYVDDSTPGSGNGVIIDSPMTVGPCQIHVWFPYTYAGSMWTRGQFTNCNTVDLLSTWQYEKARVLGSDGRTWFVKTNMTSSVHYSNTDGNGATLDSYSAPYVCHHVYDGQTQAVIEDQATGQVWRGTQTSASWRAC